MTMTVSSALLISCQSNAQDKQITLFYLKTNGVNNYAIAICNQSVAINQALSQLTT